MPTLNHTWIDLARSIQKGRTILVLGPDAVTMPRNGQRVSLQTLLREYLADVLHRRNPQYTLPAQLSLPYVAKALEDTIFVQESTLTKNRFKNPHTISTKLHHAHPRQF